MAESNKVITAVMQATDESYEKVSTFTDVAHETVDECLTDDISVVAPPLVIGRLGEQIFLVGAAWKGGSPRAGRLYLGMNEIPGSYRDNQGVLSVEVRVH